MISVIIPCYNSEKFLKRAINSVLEQTFTDWELILVNNNSTDRTAEIIMDAVHRYPEKVSTYSEERKGAPAARNRGLQKAKGDWVQFLDADDEIFIDKLERQWILANEHNGSIVSGSYYFITENNKNKPELRSPYHGNEWIGIIKSKFGRTSANLWERNKVNEAGGWNETLTSSQEYDLLFRLLKIGAKITRDDVPSCNVYAEGDSVSRPKDIDSRIRVLDTRIKLRMQIRQHLIENNLWGTDISRGFSIAVYSNLMRAKFLDKQYANKILKSLDLNVPLTTVIVGNLKYYAKIVLSATGLRKSQ